MNHFLLYHPKTRPTGRALAKLLGIPSGSRYLKQFEGLNVIRWGSLRDVPAVMLNPDTGVAVTRKEVNSKSAIALAGSKHKSLLALRDSGVIIPRCWKYNERLENGHRKSEDFISDDGVVIKPLLGRSFRHSRGTDIQIFDVGFSMVGHQRPDYYIEYIEPTREYRVHIAFGQIIRAQKKYFGQELYHQCLAYHMAAYPSDYLTPEERQVKFEKRAEFVRNNETGWRFYDIKNHSNVPTPVMELALKCVEVVGLDFGAVDIIYTKNDPRAKAFPLEINTAPGLRDGNLLVYAEALKNTLG